MTATATAPTRSGRALRLAVWVAIAAIVALVVTWFVAANNPSLQPYGMSWQSPVFVENDPAEAQDEDLPTFTVWDQPDGAWASVVITNDRPYPVTISPGPPTPATEVQVSALDPDPSEGGVIDPEQLEAVKELEVPAGGTAVIGMHVSDDRCVEMMAGSAMGNPSATVYVATFGVTSRVEVQFPATYMAGTTKGHGADPNCAKP